MMDGYGVVREREASGITPRFLMENFEVTFINMRKAVDEPDSTGKK